jgi:ribosomal protein S27E
MTAVRKLHSEVLELNQYRGDMMRVNCKECGSKSTIQARNNLSEIVAELYCSCKDPHCGHTFVMQLAYSHTLNPPKSKNDQMVLDLLASMPSSERQAIMQQFQ